MTSRAGTWPGSLSWSSITRRCWPGAWPTGQARWPSDVPHRPRALPPRQGFDFLASATSRNGSEAPRTSGRFTPIRPRRRSPPSRPRCALIRAGHNQPPAVLLHQLNQVLRGWTASFRHGVSKATFDYVGQFAWRRAICWLRRKHQRPTGTGAGGTTSRVVADGRRGVLLHLASVAVTRYRYRGRRIPTPWTATACPTSHRGSQRAGCAGTRTSGREAGRGDGPAERLTSRPGPTSQLRLAARLQAPPHPLRARYAGATSTSDYSRWHAPRSATGSSPSFLNEFLEELVVSR
jgi:hypothetical protein